jgi:hypothetical protein
VLSLASKTSVALLPLVLFFYSYRIQQKKIKDVILINLPFFICSGIFSALTLNLNQAKFNTGLLEQWAPTFLERMLSISSNFFCNYSASKQS